MAGIVFYAVLYSGVMGATGQPVGVLQALKGDISATATEPAPSSVTEGPRAGRPRIGRP